jgi:hypothetical protein
LIEIEYTFLFKFDKHFSEMMHLIGRQMLPCGPSLRFPFRSVMRSMAAIAKKLSLCNVEERFVPEVQSGKMG